MAEEEHGAATPIPFPADRHTPRALILAAVACRVLCGAILLAVSTSCVGERLRDDVDRLAEKCAAGDARSCSNLGWAYVADREGGDAAQDWAKAAQVCRKACGVGNAQACETLGTMHDLPRPGAVRDTAGAVQLYQKACDGNDAGGCEVLAKKYEFGWSVEADRDKAAQLYRKAAQLYQKDCDGGSTADCYNIGQLYDHGRAGVAQDRARAAQLYRKACDAGGVMGCYMLTRR
jgi:uncharacterized protein